MLVALAVRRSEWRCQQNKRRDTVDVLFNLLVSTFLPSRHDVSRNSTAAACSVLCPEVLTTCNYGLRPYRL